MTQRIEQQLRDAFAAGAELVRAETLRPSDQVPQPEARPRLRRPLVLAPLMAALAVVVVSLTIVAGLGDPPTVRPGSGGTPPAPRFLLTAGDDGLSIHDGGTRKITERVAMPPTPKGNRLFNPGGYVLAGTGEGTTFYVAQSVTEPKTGVSATRFYRLRVDDRGKTAEMAPDVIPPVTGAGAVVSLAVTQDGARLAYGFQCAGMVRCSGARLAIVDLTAGTTRSWSADAESIKSLSWAADARTLAFVADSEVRVLDTAAAGDTLAGSRVVVRGVESPVGAAINPDGRTIAVGGPFSQPDGEAPQRFSIEEYSVADGTRTRTLFTAENAARTVAKWTLIRYDATGRHLLIWGNVYPLSRLEDGQATVLVRPETGGEHSPDPDSPDASLQEMFAAW
ncbi:WD40 repeat domain-containing protein [Microtetraspora malaysiensis]|uniref:WD40 repeat domain-containing protein n=1 Tax=Microtetraspora malaysiensis TaxID=161358 RepID=UPI003D8A3E88